MVLIADAGRRARGSDASRANRLRQHCRLLGRRDAGPRRRARPDRAHRAGDRCHPSRAPGLWATAVASRRSDRARMASRTNRRCHQHPPVTACPRDPEPSEHVAARPLLRHWLPLRDRRQPHATLRATRSDGPDRRNRSVGIKTAAHGTRGAWTALRAFFARRSRSRSSSRESLARHTAVRGRFCKRSAGAARDETFSSTIRKDDAWSATTMRKSPRRG